MVAGAREGRSLFEVRGDDGGQWDKVLHEEVLEVHHRAAALADQNRVKDVGESVVAQTTSKGERGVD